MMKTPKSPKSQSTLEPREFLEIPCCNSECPYGNIVNGKCIIKIKVFESGNSIGVSVDFDDTEDIGAYKRKMDCIFNNMYEETGLIGTFKNGRYRSG